MKKAIFYIVTGLMAYIGFLLSSVPAALVVQWLPEMKILQVNGVSGSIWEGQAKQITVQGIPLDEVSWAFKPGASLSLARLALEIGIGDKSSALQATADAKLSSTDLIIENLVARSSLDHLQTLASIPVPADLKGIINLEIDELLLNQQGCQSLSGQLNLGQTTAYLTPLMVDIGQVESSISCNRKAINIIASQQSGMLQASAQGSLSMNGHYTLESTVTPSDTLPTTLVEGLKFIGKEDGEGQYHLQVNGQI